jgi:hypothetical protein
VQGVAQHLTALVEAGLNQFLQELVVNPFRRIGLQCQSNHTNSLLVAGRRIRSHSEKELDIVVNL